MIKSSRKLRPMKVKGKVYDPMPRNPECAPRVRSHNGRKFDARMVTYVQVEAQARKSRVLKSGIRRISYK
jgi:hypothetical protein